MKKSFCKFVQLAIPDDLRGNFKPDLNEERKTKRVDYLLALVWACLNFSVNFYVVVLTSTNKL